MDLNRKGQSDLLITDHTERGTAQKEGNSTHGSRVVTEESEEVRLRSGKNTEDNENVEPPTCLLFPKTDSFCKDENSDIGSQSKVLFLWFHLCVPRTLLFLHHRTDGALPCTELLVIILLFRVRDQGLTHLCIADTQHNVHGRH